MADKQIGIIGEVLFDAFPDGKQILGGAPFNVAWHLQAFGRHPCFISRVGDDARGASIRSAMLDWGMDTGLLQTDAEHPTGTVKISINNGEPDYDILDNQAYDFITSTQLDAREHYDIIYHGTLALRHVVSEQALHDLKTRHTGIVFLDVNLRKPWWQARQVSAWLADADMVKLNHDELMLLTCRQGHIKDLMRSFLAEHCLQLLIVTRGSQGAISLTDKGEFVEITPIEHLTIVDTVGAGDAFAAVFLQGLLSGWPLPLTMSRAQDFASALVTRRGATVSDLNFYHPFIVAWSTDS
ncbi:MAG: carbohydrate kinase [Methylovulum sp.]|nr:MAG: carbohydrate kinase [Methylovulum sp.]